MSNYIYYNGASDGLEHLQGYSQIAEERNEFAHFPRNQCRFYIVIVLYKHFVPLNPLWRNLPGAT
jgi:hypothetical protein